MRRGRRRLDWMAWADGGFEADDGAPSTLQATALGASPAAMTFRDVAVVVDDEDRSWPASASPEGGGGWRRKEESKSCVGLVQVET